MLKYILLFALLFSNLQSQVVLEEKNQLTSFKRFVHSNDMFLIDTSNIALLFKTKHSLFDSVGINFYETGIWLLDENLNAKNNSYPTSKSLSVEFNQIYSKYDSLTCYGFIHHISGNNIWRFPIFVYYNTSTIKARNNVDTNTTNPFYNIPQSDVSQFCNTGSGITFLQKSNENTIYKRDYDYELNFNNIDSVVFDDFIGFNLYKSNNYDNNNKYALVEAIKGQISFYFAIDITTLDTMMLYNSDLSSFVFEKVSPSNYIFAGRNYNSKDIFVSKYTDKELMWTKNFEYDLPDFEIHNVYSFDENYYLLYSYETGEDYKSSIKARNSILVKLNSKGEELWNLQLGELTDYYTLRQMIYPKATELIISAEFNEQIKLIKIGDYPTGISFSDTDGNFSFKQNDKSININSTNPINELQIFDLIGNEIYSGKLNSNNFDYDFEKAGVYFISFEIGRLKFLQKVIIVN